MESKLDEGDGPVLVVEDTIRQWRLHSPVDELREALLGFDALWKRKDLRLGVLRSLSNPWPDRKLGQQHPQRAAKGLYLPEANAAPIPHAVFRRRIREAIGDKEVRKILRAQLLRCEHPTEILRIVAVAMQHKPTAQNLAVLSEPLSRALYRCRKNASDPEVLRCLNITLERFRIAQLRFEPHLLQLGLKFAARARSLPCAKRYLRRLRECNAVMNSHVFRSVIAKCSIGHRGLGEIRNGRWRRENLVQFMTGFDEERHLPPTQQTHLGTYLVRSDWQYLHGWIAVLARCGDASAVWAEWELWKKNSARLQPKELESQSKSMTSKKRGDYWFVEQMAYAGDLEKAWRILAETGLAFGTLKPRVKAILLEGVEFAPRVQVEGGEGVTGELLGKCDGRLAKIELALGVKWVSAGAGESRTSTEEERKEGYHEFLANREEALEALSADDWKFDDDFGFPLEGQEGAEGLLVQETEERALHDAEEKGLATT